MTFLFLSTPERERVFARHFASALPNLPFVSDAAAVAPEAVRFILTWSVPPDLARYRNLELLFCVGAGVDHLATGDLPAGAGLVRMIEPAIRRMMQEYVTLGVLALHRGLPLYRTQQAREDWRPQPHPQATARRVGIMGLGDLGTAALDCLRPFGFPLAGWSRSAKTIPGVRSFAGAQELPEFLAETDLLVCLLPLTAETRGILNADLFARLPQGALLLHAGRGQQLDAAALLAALDRGQLAAAMLDVTDPEPLPAGDPLWQHPRILITPHVASVTQPDSAAEAVIANIRRHLAGLPPLGLVDRARGY
ncbi:2-hydroxyacid dehydrogenase [Acidisoma sp. C75]